MNRIRVCLVGLAYPFRGGIAHYTTMLYRALADRHDVLLVTLKRQYPNFLFPGTSQTDPAAVEMKVPDEPLLDSMNPITWLKAARRIRRFDPRITIFQWWMPFFGPCLGTTALLLRRFGVKRICYLCHNVSPHQKLPLDGLFSRYALRAPDRFIVHADKELDTLRRIRGNVLAAVNPHPTYEFFGNSGVPSQADARRTLNLGLGPVILFFGFVKPYKGVMDLLKAMPAIRERAGATLLIVGEFYADRRDYDGEIARLGLESHVRIVARYVPNADVAPYFAAADLVVLPYREATQSGIAQIALGLQRPCVVTRVGGLPEIIEDGVTGFTVPPQDPAALADAVVRFFEGGYASKFRAAIGHAAWKYSWDRMVGVVEALAEDRVPET